MPKDASDFQIASDVPRLDYMHCNGMDYITVPSGQYRILFVAEEATVESIRGIIDLRDFLYIGRVINREFPDHNNHKHLIIEKKETDAN